MTPELVAALAALQARVVMGGNHAYRVDGKPTPNVTTVLKVLDKPALNDWKVRTQVEGTARYAYANPAVDFEPEDGYVARLSSVAAQQFEHERISDAAKVLGHEIHALIEWHVKERLGESIPVPFVSEEAEAMFAEWHRWARDTKFTPLAAETRVYHPHDGYCGTLDLLAVVEGQPAVIDWKSSAAIYPEMRLQSAAYRGALVSAGWPSLAGYIVRVPKDGGAVAMTRLEDGPELAETFEAFRSCLRLHSWMGAQKRTRKERVMVAAEKFLEANA